MGKRAVVFTQGVTSLTPIVSRLLSNDAVRRVEPSPRLEGIKPASLAGPLVEPPAWRSQDKVWRGRIGLVDSLKAQCVLRA